MRLENLEALNERLEETLDKEVPLNKKEGYVYSRAAKLFFDRIKVLRGRGYSFVQLNRAFEVINVLPENSKPYSLRQAFHRESVRRQKAEDLAEALKGGHIPEERAKAETSDGSTAQKTSHYEAHASAKQKNREARIDDDADKERVRKMTGTTVDTGLGKIVKHSDGSFDVL